MITEPIWAEYATFDDDGFINGVRSNAPDDVKQAYAKYKAEQQTHFDKGTPIPK